MAYIEKEIGRAKDGKPFILRVDPRKQITRENKQGYNHEKRMKELHKRGYSVGQIAGMMYSKKGEFRGKEIEKAIKNKNIKLDGQV